MEWEARSVTFTVNGHTFKMVFTTVALMQIEKRYGGLDDLSEKMQTNALETVLWLAALLVNQGAMLHTGKTAVKGAEPEAGFVTEDWLALHLPPYQLKDLSRAAMSAIRSGMNAEAVEVDENAEVDLVLKEIEAEDAKNADGAGQ